MALQILPCRLEISTSIEASTDTRERKLPPALVRGPLQVWADESTDVEVLAVTQSQTALPFPASEGIRGDLGFIVQDAAVWRAIAAVRFSSEDLSRALLSAAVRCFFCSHARAC